MSERTDHMLTLFLRHEEEGHGTLFMSWIGDPGPEDLEAVGIIERAAMDADNCTSELCELIRDNAGRIAEHMTSISTKELKGD